MLETGRLYIRDFKESDWQDLYEYLSLPEIYRFEPGEPIDELEAQKLSKERSETNRFKAVVLKNSLKMIGHLYFNQILPEHFNTWELGYIFNPKYHNHGYATEAACEIIKFAFTELKAHRIIANCNTDNIASWSLLERVGMRREGCFIKKAFLRKDINNNPLWFNSYQYAILEKSEIRKFTAYCGLYCKDCIPGNNKLFDTIKQLEQIIEQTGLDKYADFKSNKNPVFNKFPDCTEVLKELKKLECSGSCFIGPHSELGCTENCKIRKCVLDKKLEGCWECNAFQSCELILKHSSFHPDLIKNIEIIKTDGIENWINKRGKHYNW